jgi:UDP-N-acetylmuramate--alanine ligase
VVFEPSWSATAGHLLARARPGDVVLTLGAGDVTLLGPAVLSELESRAAAADDSRTDPPGSADDDD